MEVQHQAARIRHVVQACFNGRRLVVFSGGETGTTENILETTRAIHEGDAPQRAIYGTATDAEVRALVEDGVGILPIPALPDDRN